MNYIRFGSYIISVVCVLLLGACSQLGTAVTGTKQKAPTSDGEKPLTGLEAYQRAGGRITRAQVEQSGTASITPVTQGITKDEDIVWAPENPDEEFGGGLEDLWQKPENTSWHVNYKVAMRQARESGKPILLWFTDSARSPLCRALSNELFSNAGFDSWASKRLVRLRVDDVIKGGSVGGDEWTKKRKYVDQLKKKYEVHGHPFVLLLSPSGGPVAQYRGYKKGHPDYYWGRIKSSVVKAEQEYGAWREKLEKRGYRLWSNRQGRKTFAKLHRFSASKVTLIDPDGKRGVTRLNKLSDADQAWILQEKQKYEQKSRR